MAHKTDKVQHKSARIEREQYTSNQVVGYV